MLLSSAPRRFPPVSAWCIREEIARACGRSPPAGDVQAAETISFRGRSVMASPSVVPLLKAVCRATAQAGPVSDRELLERFAAHRDQRAFEALVARHGGLVMGVARRVLGREADAEDAFQATFLLLAKKAGAVAWRDCVAGWLYRTAHQLARRAHLA